MAKKISELNPLTGANSATGDLFVLVDVSTNETKYMTRAELIIALSSGGFPDGTALLPSIANTGDLNTGMWFPAADTIAWSAAGAEAMRIDSAGNVLVGKTLADTGNTLGFEFSDDKLYASRSAGPTGIFRRNTSDGDVVLFRKEAVTVGSISVTGSATSYNTSSDYRLKEDAQPIVGASERVMALNPVNFAWKSDGSRVDGFLAHEAQAVVPEAVHGTKDAMQDEEYEITPAVDATYDEEGNVLTEAVPAVMGTRSVPDYQGIDQSKLVPLLTAALQEALTKIETMEARLAALETV